MFEIILRGKAFCVALMKNGHQGNRQASSFAGRTIDKAFTVHMLIDEKTELKCLEKSSDASTLSVQETPLRFTVDGRLFTFLFLRTKSQKDLGFEMKDDSAFLTNCWCWTRNSRLNFARRGRHDPCRNVATHGIYIADAP